MNRLVKLQRRQVRAYRKEQSAEGKQGEVGLEEGVGERVEGGAEGGAAAGAEEGPPV